MPRSIDADHRAALEASYGEDQPLLFLTITHDDLGTPIRVVNDGGTVGGVPATWTYDGNDYTAFPFRCELLTDTDQPPRGRIEIANVDRTIGAAILDLVGPLSLSLVALMPSEFNADVNPRTEIGTPTPIYTASSLTIREIEVDALTVRGEIQSLDDSKEPYPAKRATQSATPGVYR